MLLCDLHTHSHFSDGTESPAALLRMACRQGLSALALTDHNTVSGLPEFMDASGKTAVLAVPGVELTTSYRGRELHILGLFLQKRHLAAVTQFLEDFRQRKAASNRALVSALNRAGYLLDYEEIRSRWAGSVNRANLAAIMVEKGYVPSVSQAFQSLLSEDRGYYVPPEQTDALAAISFLTSLGAVSVLAHPFLNLEPEPLREFLPRAKEHGLTAMETRYAMYSPETAELAGKLAREFGLKESGGSDYHGSIKPEIRLGTGRGDLQVPFSFVQALQPENWRWEGEEQR